MNDIKITFFMIVTDRDVLIADYAVASYAKIRDLKFKLLVYSNWLSSDVKQKYFPRWRKYDFVEIVESGWQTDANKPTDRRLEGPYESCDTIWDRELKEIQTPYHATVDGDFEILDGSFISVMLRQLDDNPTIVAMATDYSATVPECYDGYSDEVICLNERWHTWFCIYKREAFTCTVSHAYYEEITPGPVRRNAWDSAAYFQKKLKEDHGFELAVLDWKYQPCFIHYGAFSKNRYINEKNIGLYRRLEILYKRGLFGKGNVVTRKVDALVVKNLAKYLKVTLFRDLDRSKYLPGWGQG